MMYHLHLIPLGMPIKKSATIKFLPLALLSWALFLSLSCACHAPIQQGVDRFVHAGGDQMHYVERGSGPPVILIPGLFGTYRTWDRMIPYLERHYRLIAIDNFGTGLSGRPRENFGYSVAEQADMVIAMMDELKMARCDFIGVSYGGMIALNLAARYPQRVGKVVCIEGGVIMPREHRYKKMEQGLGYPIIGHTIIGLIRSGFFDEAIARDIMGPSWEELSEDEKVELLEIIAHNAGVASRLTWLGLARALLNTPDFADEAKAIMAPVLYLSGDRSSFRDMTEMNIAYFKENLPNVRLFSFVDGVHDLELQKPEETAALARRFIKNHTFLDTNLSSR